MVNRLTLIGVVIVCLTVVGLVPSALAQGSVAEQNMSPSPTDPYTPPPCVAGVPFADVTCSTFYDAWIEQFARDGITAGCGGGNYCPNDNVTRAQMAVFIEAAMHGTASWTPANVTPDLMRVAELNWWGGPYSGGSYAFYGPYGVAFDGTHIWVTNYGGNSVTELNAADGSWVQTLSGGS
jgi:DNA-binding beta-propeller fold protein YncE